MGHVLPRLFYMALSCGILTALLLMESDLKTKLRTDPGSFVFFMVLFMSSIALYYVTSLLNPGYVSGVVMRDPDTGLAVPTEIMVLSTSTSTDDRQSLLVDQRESRRCPTRRCGFCEIPIPLRAKHCEECNHCVRRYDHHCIWMANCIGERNHKFFLMYVVVQFATVVWALYMFCMSLEVQPTTASWFRVNVVRIVCVFILALSGIFCFSLLVMHVYVMLTAQTTWECMSRSRITYLKLLEDDDNPFDEGYIRNAINFCCIFHARQYEELYK